MNNNPRLRGNFFLFPSPTFVWNKCNSHKLSLFCCLFRSSCEWAPSCGQPDPQLRAIQSHPGVGTWSRDARWSPLRRLCPHRIVSHEVTWRDRQTNNNHPPVFPLGIFFFFFFLAVGAGSPGSCGCVNKWQFTAQFTFQTYLFNPNHL